MRFTSVRLTGVLALTLASACAASEPMAMPEAPSDSSVADASAADASLSPDAAPPEPDAAAAVPPGQPRFESITVEPGLCGGTRSGLVVQSPRRVLVTTGCGGFYAVDTIRKVVTQLKPEGQAIDDDGRTVAVIAGDLGLSHDGGETFEWTSWALGRCQGSPMLTAGDGLAVVTCVAGAGRWRGAGSAFETLKPSDSTVIVPIAAADASNVVISETEGWFASTDGGDTFHALAISGLPDRVQPFGMEIVDGKLFVPAGLQDGSEPQRTALFAAPVGSGSFEQVTALPPMTGMLWLGYADGTLVVVGGGGQILLSRDQGASFAPIQIEGMPPPTISVVAKAVAGRIYVLAETTLYVAPLPD